MTSQVLAAVVLHLLHPVLNKNLNREHTHVHALVSGLGGVCVTKDRISLVLVSGHSWNLRKASPTHSWVELLVTMTTAQVQALLLLVCVCVSCILAPPPMVQDGRCHGDVSTAAVDL